MEQLILILIPKILFHIRETIHIERMHKIVSEFSALDPWLVMGFGFNGSICAQKKTQAKLRLPSVYCTIVVFIILYLNT